MTKQLGGKFRTVEALERIARALEGSEIDGDQELNPGTNLDAFWCTNCGGQFYTAVRLEPVTVTCPFCQSNKIRTKGGGV